MSTIKHKSVRSAYALAAAAVLATGLTACGQAEDKADSGSDKVKAADAIVLTYDGGLFVLDGEKLDLAEDIELKGYNRVNPAGDDRHVLVSTSTGFRVLDAAGAELTDDEFEAPKPGHVVNHGDTTVLFADGSGEATVFDPEELGDGLPETTVHTSKEPHHGVAIRLDDGEVLSTFGDAEGAAGVLALDADGKETARSEDCPGTHGEATAKDEVVAFGCQDGILLYADGEFTKVDSPDDYGRIGNQAGHHASPFVLGDYKTDKDAELERPERVSITDTTTGKLELVDLGTSYTFQSLDRGPHGEGLVLGTDGALHVIDMDSAEVTDSIPVLDEWKEPIDWQQARPSLFVRDHTAYITDPEGKKVYAVDIDSGEVTAETKLPHAPNEITGVLTGH